MTEDTNLCHETDIVEICGGRRHCGINHPVHIVSLNSWGDAHSPLYQKFVMVLKHSSILLEQYQVHLRPTNANKTRNNLGVTEGDHLQKLIFEPLHLDTYYTRLPKKGLLFGRLWKNLLLTYLYKLSNVQLPLNHMQMQLLCYELLVICVC